MSDDEVETYRHIADVTARIEAALQPELAGQHVISSRMWGSQPFALEFWWPGYGVECACLLKVVVSDATEVGVENMAWPPPTGATFKFPRAAGGDFTITAPVEVISALEAWIEDKINDAASDAMREADRDLYDRG